MFDQATPSPQQQRSVQTKTFVSTWTDVSQLTTRQSTKHRADRVARGEMEGKGPAAMYEKHAKTPNDAVTLRTADGRRGFSGCCSTSTSRPRAERQQLGA